MDTKTLAGAAGAALAASLAASPAIAQQDVVTLYGRVYVTAESVEAKGGAEPVTQRMRLADQASLLGVRGTEDLGGGLKAFFQLETQFKPDQNDTTFANRNSGVGLKNESWGSFVMGRWETPFKWANGEIDPFGNLTNGALTSVMNGSGIGGVNGPFDRRDQNVVQYWTPRWSGFEARISYSANEGKTATTDPASQGASLVWYGKGIFAGYAYHELKDQTTGIYTNTAPAQPPVLANGTVVAGKQVGQSVFAKIDVGSLRLGINYQEFTRKDPVQPASPNAQTVVGFGKQKSWMGNVVWTVGASQFIYQYLDSRGGGQQNANPAYSPSEPKCTENTIAWQYNFSKQTFVIVQYVKIDNNATATCTLGQNALAIAAGQDPEGFTVGVRKTF